MGASLLDGEVPTTGFHHRLFIAREVLEKESIAVSTRQTLNNRLFAQVRALQVRALEVRAPQVRAPQVRAPQVRAPQVRALQVRAPQVRAPQVRAIE